MDYENKVVFPYVLDLFEQVNEQKTTREITKYSVVEYKDHHNDIEEKLNDLKSFLIKYFPQDKD